MRAGPSASAPLRWCRCGTCGDAVAEIAHSLDVLKLQGVCLFASYGEKFLGDPHFDPVLAGARRARRGGVRPSGAASIEPQARSAVAGLHDGISVRHHAGGGEPGVQRRDRAFPAHPLRARACGRPDALFRLAAVGLADDRCADAADSARGDFRAAAAISGTTSRCRRRRRRMACLAGVARARADRVRQRLAVRQCQGDRARRCKTYEAAPPSRARSAPPSTAAMRCRSSRNSPDPL